MRAFVFVAGSLPFLFALVGHILIWRRRKPSRQILAFALLFLIPLLLTPTLLGILQLKLTFQEWAASYLLYLSLVGVYIQTYPAVLAISPTLQVLLLVGDALPLGLTEKQITNRYDTRFLLGDRIDDLLGSGFVREKKGKVEITFLGSLLILPSVLIRRIFGLPMGGG